MGDGSQGGGEKVVAGGGLLIWERAQGVGWGAPRWQPRHGSLGSAVTSAAPAVYNTRP